MFPGFADVVGVFVQSMDGAIVVGNHLGGCLTVAAIQVNDDASLDAGVLHNAGVAGESREENGDRQDDALHGLSRLLLIESERKLRGICLGVCREQIALQSAGMFDTRILGVRGAIFKEIACTAGQIVCSSRRKSCDGMRCGFAVGPFGCVTRRMPLHHGGA